MYILDQINIGMTITRIAGAVNCPFFKTEGDNRDIAANEKQKESKHA